MTALATFAEFVRYLRHVPTLPAEALHPWLERWQMTPTTPEEAAEQLQAAGLITALQAERVLAGKSPATMIGKYLVVDRLGSGGMGQVFLAIHPQMNRRVALKVLTPDLAANAELWERFRREARAAAMLDHPNIVRAHDMGESEGIHFIVLEHIEGASLDRYVEQRGPLPWRDAAAILHQAARGLQHAHEAGLVHRDIKPGNLLIDLRGVVKILDMGIARIVAEESGLTRHEGDQSVLGTADYLSPEQAMDSHQVDPRSDLYSLGATCRFMLTGKPLFPEGTAMQKLLWHQVKEPQPLHELRSDLPPAFMAILKRLLAKKPEERYASPRELLAALEAAIPSIAETPVPPPSGSLIQGLNLSPRSELTRTATAQAATRKAAPIMRPTTQRGSLHDTIPAAARKTEPFPLGPRTTEPIRGGRPPTQRLTSPLPRQGIWEEEVKHEKASNPRQPQRPRRRRRTLEFVAGGVAFAVIAAATFFFLWVKPPEGGRPGEKTAGRGVLEVCRYLGHTGSIRRLAVSPDGKQLLTASHDHTARLWELDTGRELAVLRGHEDETHNVAFAPDGKSFLTCGRDGLIIHYDTTTRMEKRRMSGHGAGVHMVLFTSGGADFWSASFDHTIRSWSLATGDELRRLDGHRKEVRSLALSRDGLQMLSVGLDQATYWDLSEGKPLCSFAGHSGDMLSGVIAPDRKHAFTTGKDGTIRVWGLNDGKQTQVWTGHSGDVYNLVLHPSGKYAATGGLDQTFRIWSVPDGELLCTSPAQVGWVAALAFTPDGKRLVTAGYANDARLWNLDALLKRK